MMMSIIFATIISILGSITVFSASNNKDNADDVNIVHNVHWGLLHYHKTGHDLALSLLTPFKPPQCKKTALGHVPKSSDLSLSLKTFFKSDISMLTGGFLQFNWKKTLSLENHHVRIIHFVRDPYDMVMSGYLYHSQQRAPESWLLESRFNPCKYDEDIMFGMYAKVLGSFIGDIPKVERLINSVIDVCHQLNNTYGGGKFNPLLKKAKVFTENGTFDLYDGVRLEAARSILYYKGGHVLLMGVNALFEANATKSKRVFLSDFPMSNRTKYRESVSSLFTYLMKPPTSCSNTTSCPKETNAGLPFWSCLSNANSATSIAVREAFKYGGKQAHINGDGKVVQGVTHVTSDLMSTEERNMYRARLKVDPVFGELLHIVALALRSKPSNIL